VGPRIFQPAALPIRTTFSSSCAPIRSTAIRTAWHRASP
jgi:hypothetical protein